MSLRPRSIRICAPMPLFVLDHALGAQGLAIELAALVEMNLGERTGFLRRFQR